MHAARTRTRTRSKDALIERYRAVRDATEALAAPLGPEDQVLQSMASASPTKWHRAHTTWFFETFLLRPAGIAVHDEHFAFLFNSYYDTLGDRVARDRRGMLSRPTVDEVATYRRAVDARVLEHLATLDAQGVAAVADVLELGIAHEQQHQELILTDILHAFSMNPSAPVYRVAGETGTRASTSGNAPTRAPSWRKHGGGVVEIGALDDDGFAFDNERPRHKVLLRDFEIAERAVTVGEVRAFMHERGYERPSLWLSEGYDTARARGWRAPEYARDDADGFRAFSLRGWRTPADDEVACHLSFWEAEAIARFLGARLPTEAEWEHAAQSSAPDDGNFVDDGLLHPAPASARMFGDVWQWTRSSYEPYPGFAPAAGAVGEYNGKFMAQQYVLRGGSCLTPRGHVRASYRNFWHPDTRFQMSGVRLARDA